MSLKIKSALLCDFIRTENTGKSIIIGVYNESIEFTDFPSTFSPAVWIEIVAPIQNEDLDLDVKIDFPGKKKPKPFRGSLPIATSKNVRIQMSIAPFEITEPGVFTLYMRRAGEKRWTTVLEKDIRLKVFHPPNAVPPPSGQSPLVSEAL